MTKGEQVPEKEEVDIPEPTPMKPPLAESEDLDDLMDEEGNIK